MSDGKSTGLHFQRYALWIAGAIVVLLVAQNQMQQREIDALDRRLDALQLSAGDSPGAGSAAAAPADGTRSRGGGQAPAMGGGVRAADGAARRFDGVRAALAAGEPFEPAAALDRQEHGAMVDRVTAIDRGRRTEDLRAALVEALDSDDPALQERLHEVVQDQRERERDERREQRQARWEEDTVGRIEALSQQVGLDQGQQDALFALLSRARDLTGEAFRAAREDHSFGDARQKASEFRKQADDEARALLSDKQYAAYEQMRDEEMERRGIGRGR